MKEVVCLLLLLTLAPRPPARAQEKGHPIDSTLEACLNENPSTAGNVQCIDAAYDSWDQELNRAYAELGRRLNPQGRRALRLAQAEWVKQRDAEFKLLGALYSDLQGTMFAPMMAFSRLKVVKARALQLDDYVALLKEHKR
jgi:uncharacterized protein YecT (DUF1311 family)